MPATFSSQSRLDNITPPRTAHVVKVGIVQTQSYSSDSQAIERVSRRIEGLARKETDIICLPEQWLRNNEIGDFDRAFGAFRRISKDYRATIIPGAFYHRQGRSRVITAPVIGPEGEIIGHQNKIHPFGYEKRSVSPGKAHRIFKTACRFGILVCYDMVFPDVAERMARRGAEVLVSPSRIVRRGIAPWHMYVQVRSLENRIPIAAANVQDRRFGGGGLIVDLVHRDGVMVPRIATTSRKRPSVAASFDVSRYRRHRESRFSD